MKTALNYLAIALAAVSLSVFTSCKKAEEAPAAPDATPAAETTPAADADADAPAAE